MSGLIRIFLNFIWLMPLLVATPRGWKFLSDFRSALVASVFTGVSPSLSWAQDGEDSVINTLLPRRGFYLDVGAHHPFRFSVTHRLYSQGWRGLNIDFSSKSIGLLNRFRAQDKNVQAALGNPGLATFYEFTESALNTTDQETADAVISGGYRLVGTTRVQVENIVDILKREEAPPTLGFVNLDVEGAEYPILAQLLNSDYEVPFILVELGKDKPNARIENLLHEHGYRVLTRFKRSALFQHQNLGPELTNRVVGNPMDDGS